jgi:glycosyltransferase involved in cell wall biosynthesis
LDALTNQTLKEIEIICIDDKSTDNSLSILREYETKDRRIRVIALRKNRGAAVARNKGLKIAKGTYVGFCDSDDY